MFTLSSGSAAPGSDVTLALTTSQFARSDWISADFTITWDSGVLAYKGHTTPMFTTGAEFEPMTGAFSWYRAAGTTVPNGSTIFEVTFTVNPSASLGTYTIGFDENWPLQVGFPGPESVIPTGIDGSIEAVPEPVNCALALFACLVVGSSGTRWLVRRKRGSG